jgi:hypothetical protein
MKYIPLLLITTALLLGNATRAESPVVLKVREAVTAIESNKSLKKSTLSKEVGGGEAKLTLWKEGNGAVRRAIVALYGDRGATITDLYRKADGTPLFAYRLWNSDDGANLTGSAKKKAKNHITEHRIYFDQGKPAVVRLRKGDVPSGTNRLSKSLASTTMQRDSSEVSEVLTDVNESIAIAKKGNLNDMD